VNNKFDQMAKNMAQTVTRRAALKKFGMGLAGMAMACLRLGEQSAGRPQPGLSVEQGVRDLAGLL